MEDMSDIGADMGEEDLADLEAELADLEDDIVETYLEAALEEHILETYLEMVGVKVYLKALQMHLEAELGA